MFSNHDSVLTLMLGLIHSLVGLFEQVLKTQIWLKNTDTNTDGDVKFRIEVQRFSSSAYILGKRANFRQRCRLR